MYEFYKFSSIRFIYEPAVPTSTTGMVIIAYDYGSDTILTGASEEDLLNNSTNKSCAVWMQQSISADKKNLNC